MQEFRILKVVEDNVRMSEYIEQQLGVYKKGAAFYEFMESEDLLSYKEVVHLPEDALKQEDESQVVSIVCMEAWALLHDVNELLGVGFTCLGWAYPDGVSKMAC